jgi:hypothetical protein
VRRSAKCATFSLVLSTLVAVLVMVSTFARSSPTSEASLWPALTTPTSSTTPPDSCTPQAMADEAAIIDRSFDSQSAASAALTAPQVRAAEASIYGEAITTVTGVYATWSMDPATCRLNLSAVGVDLTISGGLSLGELGVLENPVDEAVTQVTLGAPVAYSYPNDSNLTYAASGEWNGYSYEVSSSPSWGAWYIPALSPPSSHCSPEPLLLVPGVCEFLIWVGQTADLGGGGSAEGIARAGSEQELLCSWVLFEWVCDPGYALWWEFFPAALNPCSGVSVHSGDLVEAESSYSAGSYTLVAYDTADFEGCSQTESMSMGAPEWGNFIAEDPVLTIAGISSNPPLPDFSQFTMAYGDPLGHDYPGGVNDLVGSGGPYSYPWMENTPTMETSAAFYGVGEPSGVGNCISYTCTTFANG